MESILRYYDEHVRLVNNALKVIKDKQASSNNIQDSLYSLVHSISNKKGAFNIFFRKYSQDLVDGYDEDEEEYREGFEDYQHEITKHIDQNQFFIAFDPDEKIKHLNINLFHEIDLKKHHFSIKAINNLNNKELVSKVEEYIAISRYYFQFFFFGLDLTFEYIQDSFTDYFAKNREKSNTKKARLEQDQKLTDQFEKLHNNSDEIKDLEIKNIETDKIYDFQKRLQHIGSPIKGFVKREVKVIIDSNFGFNHSYIEDKQKLIEFIEHSCFRHNLLKDLEQKKELTKHLFSKNLLHLEIVTIDFNKKTNVLSTFLDFIKQYFESGLNEKIERRKLFKSQAGADIKANNLNNAAHKVDFFETLKDEYQKFNQKA